MVCIVESQRKRLADVQLGQKREVLVANGDTWAVKETMDGIHKKSIRACEMSPDGTFRLCAASIVE